MGFHGWLSNGYRYRRNSSACSLRVCPEVATRASSGYNRSQSPPQLIRGCTGGFTRERSLSRRARTTDKIAGHIPGAVNYPWQEVSDAQGYLLAMASQRRRWEKNYSKLRKLVYCGSGVTACVNLLSLKWLGLTLASFIVVVGATGVRSFFCFGFWNLNLFSGESNACSESELVVIKLRLNLRKYALTLLVKLGWASATAFSCCRFKS